MELHELHVHERGAGVIGERVAVAGVLPTVAGDFEGATDAAGGQHNGLSAKQLVASTLAFVTESSGHAAATFEQRDDGAFHMHIDALMDAVILEGADHLEAGAIADVGQAGIFVSAEIALEDAAVLSAIEHRTPGFQLTHAVRRFLGVQLSHARIVQILTAAHSVGEMDAPVVAIVDVAHRRRDAAFGHDGVSFAEERFGDDADLDAGSGRFNGGAQSGATRADDQDIMFEGLILGHL